MPMDWNSDWKPKHVLVSDICDNGPRLYSLCHRYSYILIMLLIRRYEKWDDPLVRRFEILNHIIHSKTNSIRRWIVVLQLVTVQESACIKSRFLLFFTINTHTTAWVALQLAAQVACAICRALLIPQTRLDFIPYANCDHFFLLSLD